MKRQERNEFERQVKSRDKKIVENYLANKAIFVKDKE
jgi:hypothetical protein